MRWLCQLGGSRPPAKGLSWLEDSAGCFQKGGLKAHLLHQQPPEGLHQGFLGGQVQDTGGEPGWWVCRLLAVQMSGLYWGSFCEGGESLAVGGFGGNFYGLIWSPVKPRFGGPLLRVGWISNKEKVACTEKRKMKKGCQWSCKRMQRLQRRWYWGMSWTKLRYYQAKTEGKKISNTKWIKTLQECETALTPQYQTRFLVFLSYCLIVSLSLTDWPKSGIELPGQLKKWWNR